MMEEMAERLLLKSPNESANVFNSSCVKNTGLPFTVAHRFVIVHATKIILFGY